MGKNRGKSNLAIKGLTILVIASFAISGFSFVSLKSQQKQLSNTNGAGLGSKPISEPANGSFTSVAGINTSGGSALVISSSSGNNFQIQGAAGVSISNISTLGNSLTVLSGPAIQQGQIIVSGGSGQVLGATSTSNSFENTVIGDGLVRTGTGTASDPYVLSIIGCSNAQVLQSSSTAWRCGNLPAPTASTPTYTAGTGISINGSNVISANLGNSISASELEQGAVTSNVLSANSVSSLAIINGSILLDDIAGNGCNVGQLLKYTGSSWACDSDNAGAGAYTFTVGDGTNTQLIDNSDLLQFASNGSLNVTVGATDTVTLSVASDAITSAEILNGTVLLADIAGNGCSNGQTFKYNGSAWVCATDNVNDADASATNELQDLSLGVNILSLSGSAATINLAGYLDNTDAQNLSYVAGTQTLSIGGGNSVVLSSLLDNTDSQAISRSGNTVSITGNAGTVDLSPYLDNTDVLASLSCSNSQIAQWNGSAWVCVSASVNTDNQTLSIASNNLSITGGNSVSLSGYLDNTDSQAISRSGNTVSITGNAGTVDLSPYLDNTDVLAGLSCSNTQIAKYNGSAWVCATDAVDDADASASNELQDLSLTTNTLSLSGSGATINLAPYLDNTDSQNLSYVAGTQVLSIGGGNNVSLSSLLDNTDSQAISRSSNTISITGNAGTVDLSPYLDNTDGQAISKTGNTLSITGNAGTVDLSGYIDNTDVLAGLSCSNTQIAKYNGSAWVCGTDNVNDADASATNELQDLSLSVNVLSLSSSAPTINLAGYLDNTDSQNVTYTSATQVLSISGGNTASLASLLDNTDAQAISKTGNTLAITGNAGTVDLSGYLDNTDVLGSLSCSNTQIAKYNGSAWVCASDADTNTTYTAGTGLTLTGTTFSSDLGADISSTEIVNGTILFADIASNSCSNGEVFKYNGSVWICGTDNINDADASATNELQDLSLSVNVLSLSSSAPTINLAPYLDNTDAQNLSYVAGTQTLSIGGGNSVILSSLLDNTDAQAISRTGNTVSITGNAGTVDLSPYLDNTDVLGGLSCSNTQIAKYNGSAWVCGTDNVNDADASATNELQDLGLAANTLSLTASGATVDLSPYLDNTDAQAISKTGNTLAITGNAGTVDLSGYLDNTDSQNLSYVAGTQVLSIGGGNNVSLSSLLDNTDAQSISRTGNTVSITGNAGTVDLSPYLDNTDVLGLLSCSNTQIAKYNGSAWICATDNDTNTTYSAGTGLTLTGTTFSNDLGTDISSGEILNGTILFADIASNSCANGDIFKYNGSVWICGTDNSGGSVNSFETISTTGGTSPVADSSTDILTLAAGSGITVIGDNTTDTITVTAALGTAIDNTEITDGTILFADIGTNGCSNNQIIKYNGSAWICGADVDTDTTYSAGTGISFGGTVISSTLGTDIDSAEIVNGTIAAGDVAANTFAQLGLAAAQTDTSTNGLIFINKTGASGNLLQLQVAGANTFLVAYDGTIDTPSVDSTSIVNASIANGDLANSSLTVSPGTGLTGGGAVSLGGTVTLNSSLGTSVDNTEIDADSLDFSELKDSLSLDATTTIAAGANAFNINLDGAGDFVVQDNGTAVLTISDSGTLLFKNSADTAASFVIQKAGSTVDVLAIDTTGDGAVYIGDVTPDGTGSLLVLDTKNTTGDPTGVNGAMYYNSFKGKFRCYENSDWRDCMTSSRTGYLYRNEMMGSTSENELVYAVTGAGAANSATALTSVAGRPGVMQQATGTTATGNARGVSGNANGILLGNSSLFSYETAVRVTTLSTGTERFSYRTGFIDNGAAESTDGCFFRYSDSTNGGKWEGVCRNNSAETVCDTGIAVGAGTWYRLNITVNTAGTNANFATDGTSRCNVAANIPTGAGRGTGIGLMMLKSIGTTTRTIDVDYIEVRAEVPNR